jgi:hypothetical protein
MTAAARLQQARASFGADCFFAKLGTRSGKDAVLYVASQSKCSVVMRLQIWF